ncbi:MAG: hypothetical protein H0U88_03195, partial [Chthoniobacterales bacterium]|nr:hypothetical protein [Chthoniobacterales bacterium]
IGNGVGISAFAPPNLLIGGTAAGAGNVISGNAGSGIALAAAPNALVQGNLIGTQKDGISPLGNGGSGVALGFQTGGAFGGGPDTIGGTVAGARNTIAFNGAAGIHAIVGFFGGSGSAGQGQHTILGNSIFSNGGLGIDLGGVGPNDTGDADGGINSGQNFPTITSVTNGGGNTAIAGTLNSNASTNYRIEFFANDAIDPSGFGEGQTFLGFVNVTTNASGNASFNASFPQIAAGKRVTSTATNANARPPSFQERPVSS